MACAEWIRGVCCGLWLVGAASLAACGGGGGGGNGTPPPPPPALSSNADLDTLAIEGITLDPAFSPAQTSYSASVGFLVRSLEVTASLADSAASLEVDGQPVDPAVSPLRARLFLDEGVNSFAAEVTAEDGTARLYTLEITRETAASFGQKAYIKASNTGADGFGMAVAVSGDTLVVGAPGEASAAVGVDGDEDDNTALDAGAVYVFERDADGAWAQQAYVKASNTDSADHFGLRVALDGGTLAVGAFGEDSAAVGIDGDQADDAASDSGAVYVFVRDAQGIWTQQAYVKASNTHADSRFGQTLALDGDWLAVGAPGESGLSSGIGGDESTDVSAADSGAVYLFRRDAGAWAQQAYVKASNAAAGDQFGTAVDLDADTLAVGAPLEDGDGSDEADDSAADAGAVYVLLRDAGGAWSQQAYVKASTPAADALFGAELSIARDTLAVTALNEGSGRGAVRVFDRDASGGWAETGVLSTDPGAGTLFGRRIALAGDTLAVGFDTADDDRGAAFVYTRDPQGAWTEATYLTAAIRDALDAFGTLAMDDNTLVVGAAGEASAATGINGDQSSNGIADAGAVYTFGAGAPSDNARIARLDVAPAALDQIFQPDQTAYTSTLGFVSSSLTLALVREDGNATVTVDGEPLPADGRIGGLGVGLNSFEIVVTAQDGATNRYTLDVTRESLADFTQRAYVKASNPGIEDTFGFSVALDGDTLAVGAPYEDGSATGIDGPSNDLAVDAGAVYVFTRDGAGVWSQQAYVKASNTGAGDLFGSSVALHGDRLVVGAPGEANAGGTDSAPGAGAVYVFERVANVWAQTAYLKHLYPDAGDNFGNAVALEGDVLAVGIVNEDSAAVGIGAPSSDNSASGAGAVVVFERVPGSGWTRSAYIKASNTTPVDEFGFDLAMSGGTLVVGAPREDGSSTGVNGDQSSPSASEAGAVYVFVRGAAGWSQQAYVKASNTNPGDWFGRRVAIDADTLAVGAIHESSAAQGVDGDEADNSALYAGAVYVFVRNADAWSQQAYLKASNAEALDAFGFGLAVSGDTLVVGASDENSNATGINGDEADNSLFTPGAAYLFTRDTAGAWSQRAYLKASNTGDADWFGYGGIAIDFETVAIGARREAGGAAGVNGDEADNTAGGAGAVYVFR